MSFGGDLIWTARGGGIDSTYMDYAGSYNVMSKNIDKLIEGYNFGFRVTIY